MKRKKTLRKKQKKYFSKRNKKYGGSYYAYNKNPLRFTSSTSQMGGGFTMDTRNTLLPQPVVNLFRTGSDIFSSTTTTSSGQSKIITSDPTNQPYLIKTS
jgi:hypothetical protein